MIKNSDKSRLTSFLSGSSTALLGVATTVPGIRPSSAKERLEQLEETKRELEARIAEEKPTKPRNGYKKKSAEISALFFLYPHIM